MFHYVNVCETMSNIFNCDFKMSCKLPWKGFVMKGGVQILNKQTCWPTSCITA